MQKCHFSFKKMALVNAIFLKKMAPLNAIFLKKMALTNATFLKKMALLNAIFLKRIQISVFHFSLYYNVNGVRMARRYWRIPSSSLGKKKSIPHSRLRRSCGIHFFCRGIQMEFSNTRNHHAITTLLSTACVSKNPLTK